MQQTCANKCSLSLRVHVCVREGNSDKERTRQRRAGLFGTFMSAPCWQIQPPNKKPVTSPPSARTHTHTHTHRTYLCTHIKPLFYFIKTHTQTFTQAAKHIRTHPLCRQRPPTNLPPSIHFQYFPLPIPDPSLQASAPALLPGRQPLPPVINFHMR